MSEMTIPEGLTCGDCAMFHSCAAIIGMKNDSRECDFYPVKFVPSIAKFAAVRTALKESEHQVSILAAACASLENPWIPVSALTTPLAAGALSEPMWVCAWDFGCAPVFAICRYWLSSQEGAKPKWYYDQEFYGMDAPREIAWEVRGWMPLPEIPQEMRP